jgi:hypothetical protein
MPVPNAPVLTLHYAGSDVLLMGGLPDMDGHIAKSYLGV